MRLIRQGRLRRWSGRMRKISAAVRSIYLLWTDCFRRIDMVGRGALLIAATASFLGIAFLLESPLQTFPANQPEIRYQIDLLTASEAELQLIPGFGITLANRWVEQRESLIARYQDPAVALQHMSGVGEAKFAQMKKFLQP